MKKPFILACLLCVVLFGCEKLTGSDCPKTEHFELVTNSPVIEGWPLTLTAPSDMSYTYRWTGPNGFRIDYDYYSSSAYAQGKLTTVLADGGVYKVEMIDDQGCVAKEGSATVKIIPTPAPPCSLPANSSVATSGFLGNHAFIPNVIGGNAVEAHGNGETLRMSFETGINDPKPGIYKSSGYFPRNEKEVALWIQVGYTEFLSMGQDVYVRKINGKLDISFCDHTFSNPVSSTPLKVSARVVEP